MVAGMVEIRALTRFRGRNSVMLSAGDTQTVPTGFASIMVRRRMAEYTKPERKAPAPSERKVVEPHVKKEEPKPKPVAPKVKASVGHDEKDALLALLDAAGVGGFNRRHSVKTLKAALAEAEVE